MRPPGPVCPLCGSREPRRLTEQRGFAWARCGPCDLAFLWPVPTGEDLARAYQSYLPRDGRGMAAWRRLMADVFREALAILGPAPPGARLLDVGCAYGHFLEAAAAAGWDARGIDLSAHAVGLARSRGLDARVAAVDEADFEEGAFDVVTLFYVLEHVPEPLAVTRRVLRWLRPGGRLLVRVPHTAPLVRALGLVGIPNELLDPPFHLLDFSPRSLRRVLEEAGFAEVVTFPGASTRPAGVLPFLAAKLSSGLAAALYRTSAGRLLLPGVSKTTLARRPVA